MKISLDFLHILVAIEQHGSLSAAAAALHRVPSALSHAIAKQESDLGTPLFNRQGRKVLLNDAGRCLLEEGRYLLRAAEELERRVQRVATGWESELRIAVDCAIPIQRLYPLLESFYAAGHPTRIRLSTEVLGGCWDALATDRADLAIGAPGDLPARGGISSRVLCQFRMCFAVAPQHPLATYPGPIPDEELAHHRGIVISDTSRELSARSAGLQPGLHTLEVPSMQAKAEAQIAGLGIGHLPYWLAADALRQGQLIEKTLASPRPMMPCHIAWRPRNQGQAGRWFLTELAKKYRQDALTAGMYE